MPLATPLMIDMAVFYYTRTSSHGDYGRGNGDNNFDAPAVQEALQQFESAGLVSRVTLPERKRDYEPTEGLRVWVEALCEVPWPEMRWVLPDD